MKSENELNREYALKLSKLILDNPNMRVIAEIDSEGITDDYAWWAGDLNEPYIQTIAWSDITEHYFEREGNDYVDCSEYYGSVADYWNDETLAKKVAEIPWEDVVLVKVSIT